MYKPYIFTYSEDEINDMIQRCNDYAHCIIKPSAADKILMYKEYVCIRLKTEARYTQREFAKEKGLPEPAISERLNTARYKLYNMLRGVPRVLLAPGKMQCDLTVLQALFDIDVPLAAKILQIIYYSRSRKHYWP